MFYWIFKFIFKAFYTLFFCYEVRGSDNMPSTGGVIIAANHLSYLDPPLIGICIKRKATFMARDNLFHNPLIGWFVRMFSIPVDRETPKPSRIKMAVKKLKEGHVIVMFPEGTRSKDGHIGGGRRGVGMIAAMSRIPVVPALIEGTDKVLPVGARFIKPAKVRVTFGKPLEHRGTESNKDFQQRITDEVMDKIRELKDGH